MEYVEAIVPIQHALVGKGLTPYKPLRALTAMSNEPLLISSILHNTQCIHRSPQS